MGAACSTVNSNVVHPCPIPKPEEEPGQVIYRNNPVAVVGVRGIRNLRETGSDYWGEKYVGDM